MTGTAKSEVPAVASATDARAHSELADGPKYLPILSRHDVYLFWLAGEGRRFAGLFRRAWGRLPLWARRKLLKRWRERRSELQVLGVEAHWPHIELIANKSNFSRGNSGNAVAQTSPSAASFAFDAATMDALPDTAVEAVVGHELAHAIYFIGSRQEHLADAPYDEWGFSQAEYDADELAEGWGFDIELLNTAGGGVLRVASRGGASA